MEAIIVVAGGAGSGKTTLGRALCADIGAQLLDLDAATADLVEAASAARPEVAEAEVLRELRDARYAELIRQARAARSSGPVVMAAPFTREISDSAKWADFVAAVGGAPVHLAWIEVSPQERLRRMTRRGASRDAHLLQAEAAPAVPEPAVPFLRLPAGWEAARKIAAIRSQFDNGSASTATAT